MIKQFKNVVWQEGKYFVAQCLNIDISSFGESKEEALKNLQEATELYLEDADQKSIAEVTSPEIISSTLNYA
jgi:predicted RNase H-like HicB family nuclease